jgi:hypothetical protein
MKISRVISDVYTILGTSVGDQLLPLRVVLTELLEVSDRRYLEAALSDRNLLVRTFELSVGSPDLVYTLPVDDFGEAVRVEYISPTTGDNYSNVEIVNHNNLHLYKGSGRPMSISFFGTPQQCEVTYASTSPTTLRVWYQPDIQLDQRTIESFLPFNNIFQTMIVAETAFMCLSHLGGRLPMEQLQMLNATLRWKLAEWEPLWKKWTQGQLNRSTIRKRGYNDRRRRGIV